MEETAVEWKMGIVCPIYKKSERNKCDNYRGTTVLNCTCKVLSSVIINKLTENAKKNK